jgi:hypothetical protein
VGLRLYLAAEFIEGRSLADRLEEGRFPRPRCQLALEALERGP